MNLWCDFYQIQSYLSLVKNIHLHQSDNLCSSCWSILFEWQTFTPKKSITYFFLFITAKTELSRSLKSRLIGLKVWACLRPQSWNFVSKCARSGILRIGGPGYQPPITYRNGSSQVPKGLSMTPPTHLWNHEVSHVIRWSLWQGGQRDQGL